MTWLARMLATIGRWLYRRHDDRQRVRLGAIRHEVKGIRAEFESRGLLSERMQRRFERVDELTTERQR